YVLSLHHLHLAPPCAARTKLALSQTIDPIAQQLNASLARLLGMKLSRTDRTIFNRCNKPFTVCRPGDLGPRCFGSPLERPVDGGVTVHEIKAFCFNACKKRRTGRCLDRVPPHVRQSLSLKLAHRTGPLPETFA